MLLHQNRYQILELVNEIESIITLFYSHVMMGNYYLLMAKLTRKNIEVANMQEC